MEVYFYMDTIKKCWMTIELYLKEYAPSTYKTLAPPASSSEIDKMIKSINMKIPESLIQSLLIHNGQQDEFKTHPLLDFQHILSCEEIISTYTIMNDIFPDEDMVNYIEPFECKMVSRYYIWNKKWLPITESNGDGLIMDFYPSSLGTEGQIFYRPNSDNPPDKVLAVSYEDWMVRICKKLENNEFKVEDESIILDSFTFDW